MKIKIGLEEEFQKAKENNKDPYGACGYRYLERWADMMEAEIINGKKLTDVAKETSHKANTEVIITGFMYGRAVQVLSYFWEHGEELRQWHNLDTQLKTEGEEANKNGTVLNPAVLSIRG